MPNSKYNYVDKHTLYHMFSKTPVRAGQELGDIVNKSGHTVLSKQLFVDEIPWFPKFTLIQIFSSKITQKSALGVDYVVIGNKSTTTQEFTTNVYKRNTTEYSDIITVNGVERNFSKYTNVNRYFADYITAFWTPVNLVDGYQVYNKDNQRVLVYHKDVALSILTTDNNAQQNSNDSAARAFDSEGNVYELFVSGMESIHHAIPSIGLNPVVSADKEDGSRTVLKEKICTDEDFNDPDKVQGYFANNFNGTIFFNKAYQNPSISFFQYVGRTLDKKIVEVDDRIDDIEKSLGTFTTKSEFDDLVSKVDDITSFTYTKVDELPSPSADCTGKIYLVQVQSDETDNIHEEFICVETEVDGTKTYSWELIGTTKIDLSGYALKSDITLNSINGVEGDSNNNITIKIDENYHGSDIIENSGETNTITFNPAGMWEYDGDSFVGIVRVENGVCYDGNDNVVAIIDDGNLTKGYKDDVGMFVGNATLTSFVGDLSSLEDGSYMFMGSEKLETFVGDLGKLENGSSMFFGCSNLKNVNTDLSSLIMGSWMFVGCNLTKNSIEIICDMLPTAPENDHTDNIYTIHIDGDDSQDTKTYVNDTASAKNWKIVFNNITYPLSE